LEGNRWTTKVYKKVTFFEHSDSNLPIVKNSWDSCGCKSKKQRKAKDKGNETIRSVARGEDDNASTIQDMSSENAKKSQVLISFAFTSARMSSSTFLS
jgi:hypothetical protein